MTADPPVSTPDTAPAGVAPGYTVAVRTLCEFTAKVGDLDLRFTPAPSAQQGMAGHGEVTSRRPAHYEREVTLAGSHRHLRVRGRADGFDPKACRVEEIKTHRRDLQTLPGNQRALHWAQARVYGWLLCQDRGLQSIDVALVYYDINSQKETVLSEACDAASLRAFFESLCERFLVWADQELAHRTARDAALTALQFPHESFRAGQRELAETVYRSTLAQGRLLAQAPTGIGKTVGTLFPLLKACPGQRIDKVFYLTAKTPGRQLALDALRQIRGHAAQSPVRTLELVAKDKACEHPGKACHGESCPLALGFYDRLPQARQAAWQAGDLSRQTLRSVAQAHGICPYYLGQEMTRWSDVVIGDYNHFFDVSAGLHTLTVMEDWRVSLLVDEAHNLVERSRQMYTARLDQDHFDAARRVAPPPIRTAMSRLQREWTRLLRDQTEDYQVHAELPEPLVGALQKLVADTTDWLAQDPTSQGGALQAFYFEALHFLRIAEVHGVHALFDASLGAAGTAQGARHSVLCLRNVVPAPLLKSRWAAAASATLFSATLSPPEYLKTLLGLPEDTGWIDVPSAFDPSQLQVRVARRLSTRYNDRTRSLAQLVQLMADQYRQRPGNYLAFFSSYAYLQMAVELLGATHPELPIWVQSAGMGEAQRSEFLARFVPEGQGIGFAVLGGAFGEGIDLPGTRLIGAFIATLGLSQVNPVNEQIRERMQSCLGNGYEYTYLYPGIQKVVQAAGRVIRTTQDHGVVHLMDDRFARPEIRSLLPQWWALE